MNSPNSTASTPGSPVIGVCVSEHRQQEQQQQQHCAFDIQAAYTLSKSNQQLCSGAQPLEASTASAAAQVAPATGRDVPPLTLLCTLLIGAHQAALVCCQW